MVNKVKKIVSVVGARPQFIKALPVSLALKDSFKEVLIHTGQHYDKDMSQVFFDELKPLSSHYNLGVGSASHGCQTGQMLIRLEGVLLKEKPDLVLVYGDTNSTLAGALAAVKLHLLIGHVEAGLRSFDKKMPEEVNRVLVDHMADFLFCPTQASVNNLLKEGIKENVFQVGDVMYDSVLLFQKKAESSSKILKKLKLEPKEYLLCTIHRASNTDIKENLSSIIKALIESGEKTVFPVHPRTRKYLSEWGLDQLLKKAPKVRIIKPLGYLDFLQLEKNARKILTDSGGVQKEAYFFKVPCLTLRETTEWIETVEAGWNKLVGTKPETIIQAIKEFFPPKRQKNLYGDGKSSEKIKEILMKKLS